MQDIGGLRAVVSTVGEVLKLKGSFFDDRSKHKLNNAKDYIEKPKESGYRSTHLIFKYKKLGPVQLLCNYSHALVACTGDYLSADAGLKAECQLVSSELVVFGRGHLQRSESDIHSIRIKAQDKFVFAGRTNSLAG